MDTHGTTIAHFYGDDSRSIEGVTVQCPNLEEGHANRFRTVACVNALAGIPDPAAFVSRVRAMEEFIKDLASSGTRFDLTPTVRSDEPGDYVEYIRRIDTSIRERAKSALTTPRRKEGKTMASIDNELDFINRLAVECATHGGQYGAGRAEGIREAVRGLMPKVQDRLTTLEALARAALAECEAWRAVCDKVDEVACLRRMGMTTNKEEREATEARKTAEGLRAITDAARKEAGL